METRRGYGVIPYRKVGAEYEWLLIQHTEGHWGFPKGHAEDHETALETAQRELHEETGIAHVRIDDVPPIVSTYSFVRDDVSIQKTVTYFLGEISEDQKLSLQESEVQNANWFSYTDALQHLQNDVTTQRVGSNTSADVLTRAYHSLLQ